MRIGLDVTQGVKLRGRGIARYVLGLVGALPSARPGLELVLFVRGARWWRRRRIAELAPASERRWALWPLAQLARSMHDLDAFHGLGTQLPASAHPPTSFTLHDLRDFADEREPLDRRRAPRRGRRKWHTVQRASAILCPSEYGARRLVELYPWKDAARVAAIPHGIDQARFRRGTEEETRDFAAAQRLTRPFALQVGSFFPHKNLELSIAAFARSRARREGFELVFCGGGASSAYSLELRELASRLGVAERLRWLEHIDESDLPRLYSAAHVLLFPSRYEGFGFPILEAMACGLPGVTSDSTCLREVSAGIWPAVGSDDAEEMAAELDRTLFDTGLRATSIARGLEHASSFTWRRCAERTADFLMDTVVA